MVNDKKEIESKLAAFGRLDGHGPCGRHWHSLARQGANRFEPEIELYREAVHVGELAESGKAEENREKLAVWWA